MAGFKNKPNRYKDFAQDINDSFLANINHALRSPLNGVIGMVELLAKTGLSNSQLQYAHTVRESTENLMLQLDNIIELAKIENGELEITPSLCRVDDIIKGACLPFISMAADMHMPIVIKYAHDLPEYIFADEDRLTIIIKNLLSCALKYSERGEITLNITANHTDTNGIIKLFVSIENSKALDDVLYGAIDQYAGMSAHDLRDFGEITVSLITAQKLLEAMEAEIGFDTPKVQELPFHFRLPVSSADETLPASKYSIIKGKRALILQKNILDETLVKRALDLWGLDVRVVDSPENMVKMAFDARNSGNKFDFFFTTEECFQPRMIKYLEDCDIPYRVMIGGSEMPPQNLLTAFTIGLKEPLYLAELLSALSECCKDGIESKPVSLAYGQVKPGSTGFKKVKANILLVEDDSVSRIYATRLLEGFGCRVVTAEDGQHALTRLRGSGTFDAIFMDCMMPRLDGYLATQEIRKSGLETIPIIALTANTMEHDKAKCLAAGMNDYIKKPLKESDLHAMLLKYVSFD